MQISLPPGNTSNNYLQQFLREKKISHLSIPIRRLNDHPLLIKVNSEKFPPQNINFPSKNVSSNKKTYHILEEKKMFGIKIPHVLWVWPSIYVFIFMKFCLFKSMFCNHPGYFPRRKNKIGVIRERTPKIWKSSLGS